MAEIKRQNGASGIKSGNPVKDLADARNKLISRRHAMKKVGLTFASGTLGFLSLGIPGILQQKASARGCEGSCSGSCVGKCASTCGSNCNGKCVSSCVGSCVDTCVINCSADCEGICKGACKASCDGTTDEQSPWWEEHISPGLMRAPVKEPP